MAKWSYIRPWSYKYDQLDNTGEGETDVFYIDTTTGSVVKRVELIDIVGEDKAKSACRFVACSAGKLYIMDMGLDCIYVLYQKDGEEQAEVFGKLYLV